MIKNKKPWYIWLSFIALVVLSRDTSRRISHSPKFSEFSGWERGATYIFKTAVFYVLIPSFCIAIPVGILFITLFPDLYLAENIAISIWYFVLYLSGVRATYKHVIWRKENIPDLLNGTETDLTS